MFNHPSLRYMCGLPRLLLLLERLPDAYFGTAFMVNISKKGFVRIFLTYVWWQVANQWLAVQQEVREPVSNYRVGECQSRCGVRYTIYFYWMSWWIIWTCIWSTPGPLVVQPWTLKDKPVFLPSRTKSKYIWSTAHGRPCRLCHMTSSFEHWRRHVMSAEQKFSKFWTLTAHSWKDFIDAVFKPKDLFNFYRFFEHVMGTTLTDRNMRSILHCIKF